MNAGANPTSVEAETSEYDDEMLAYYELCTQADQAGVALEAANGVTDPEEDERLDRVNFLSKEIPDIKKQISERLQMLLDQAKNTEEIQMSNWS